MQDRSCARAAWHCGEIHGACTHVAHRVSLRIGVLGEAYCSHCMYLSLWAGLQDPCQCRGKQAGSAVQCAGLKANSVRGRGRQGSELTSSKEHLSLTHLGLQRQLPGQPVVFASLPGAAGKIKRSSTWSYIGCLSCFHHCAFSGLAQSYLCTVYHACAPWRGKSRSAGDGLALCHRLCLPSTPHCLPGHLLPMWSCASSE